MHNFGIHKTMFFFILIRSINFGFHKARVKTLFCIYNTIIINQTRKFIRINKLNNNEMPRKPFKKYFKKW